MEQSNYLAKSTARCYALQLPFTSIGAKMQAKIILLSQTKMF
jgi:hypothetical protein